MLVAREGPEPSTHYEPAASLKITPTFNNLPRAARCDWHDAAQPSTTDSRRSPAFSLPDFEGNANRGRFPRVVSYAICMLHMHTRPALDCRPPRHQARRSHPADHDGAACVRDQRSSASPSQPWTTRDCTSCSPSLTHCESARPGSESWPKSSSSRGSNDSTKTYNWRAGASLPRSAYARDCHLGTLWLIDPRTAVCRNISHSVREDSSAKSRVSKEVGAEYPISRLEDQNVGAGGADGTVRDVDHFPVELYDVVVPLRDAPQ
jgi:hypothetical protein